MSQEQFTKYEVARILGARGLQIAMDAPLLLKISEDDLKLMKYDSLRIAEKEFYSKVLPISIDRPMPDKKEEKLRAVKEEKIDDAQITKKKEEVEKEITENAESLGFAPQDEGEDLAEESSEGQ